MHVCIHVCTCTLYTCTLLPCGKVCVEYVGDFGFAFLLFQVRDGMVAIMKKMKVGSVSLGAWASWSHPVVFNNSQSRGGGGVGAVRRSFVN